MTANQPLAVPQLTQEQAAIISAYTGVLCGDFSAMHAYIEKKLGHPVFTHQMGNKAFMGQVQDAARDDFLALCAPSNSNF